MRKPVPERAAFGVSAVAVGMQGHVLVLDALHERIVRVEPNELTFVAKVARDADDLAVSDDGAIAVRRSMTPRIAVLGGNGEPVGEVDARAGSSGADVDSLALGPSRQVRVRTSFQETFSLGSPSFVQLASAVARSRKVGAELLPNGDGVVSIVKNGEAELRVVAQAKSEDDHATTKRAISLGRADSARVVGVSAEIACLRLEHVTTTSEGALAVDREAVCIDTANGSSVFQTKLGPPGMYVPRRELAFARHKLVFARPEEDGLRISTWIIEGGAR